MTPSPLKIFFLCCFAFVPSLLGGVAMMVSMFYEFTKLSPKEMADPKTLPAVMRHAQVYATIGQIVSVAFALLVLTFLYLEFRKHRRRLPPIPKPR
jgi:hypothetical protein